MRGRPPKPTALKLITGNPGKRPLNDREPRPAAGAPSCPKWLHEYARAEWRRVVKVLEPIGLVTQADLAALAGYCQAWAEFRLATEQLDREGRTVEDDEGWIRTHPAVGQQRSAWQACRQFAALFGLDPSSRSRIVTPPVPQRDELEDFLGGRA